ncbi:NAD(P)H-dependent glycerol-3-phosphate dehydrogenase [Gallaecimonas xiamenensis]|uniref:Glycerol-3-phosphate dehydrogenase [NAD(P)+] n=1 Tax=Gallaecimonas xiamenensis 3-C-1 TaxID=745411 RepID=K2K6J6_9GAMM|nr:NAD(P)H-dependent glycerol-3-phosphate dehydrogenase [Gallaecimonas xiamenensis]EKE73045.1 NAD(P)H-dependent glycerol-3-phosphate dehydrogenase [Gallaecimonas xiamenensis 3-C-1]
MTAEQPAICVLGAGSYGTALAISLARNGNRILLWGHNATHLADLAKERQNRRYLEGIPFPDSLEMEPDLAKAVSSCRDILVVVPSHAFDDVLNQMKPHLRPDARVAWATKGLEPDTGRLLQDAAREVLGDTMPLAVVSGPTFAKELAAGLPTAISISSTDEDFMHRLADLLHCEKRLRTYANPDFIGVQLGGAVKNVIAIGAGMADGLGFGANARTALITRGLVELSRLGAALGADPATFMGMSGLGDLVLTCTDNQSRNRRFGLALGQGKGAQQAMDEIGQVVEGYRNAKEVFELAKRLGVEMPITEQIYAVLYEGRDPKEASKNLLARERKSESLS